MSRADKLAFLAPLMILSITVVFTYLITILISLLGPASIILAWILSGLVVLFFIILAAFGLKLVLVTIPYWTQHYTMLRKKEEVELALYNRQAMSLSHPRSVYWYRANHPQIRRSPHNNPSNDGS